MNNTVGVLGVSVGPLCVSRALERSSQVALLNGDWTIRTEGQRAAHHRDSGIAQPSLGGPLPWVSGSVAPDQRTARPLEGRRSRVGWQELERRQGGDEGRPRQWGLGIRGQTTVGIPGWFSFPLEPVLEVWLIVVQLEIDLLGHYACATQL